MIYRLTEKADFGQIYDLELLRYGPEKWALFNITKEQFINAAVGVPSVGFEASGKLIGGAFFIRHELHLTVHPDHHGKWGRLVRLMCEWLYKIEDPVSCKIEVDNEKCIRFAKKAGWTQIAADERFVTFQGSGELLKRRPRKTKQLTGEIDALLDYSPTGHLPSDHSPSSQPPMYTPQSA